MEIPSAAKKCPYCHQRLSAAGAIMDTPAVGDMIHSLPLAAVLLILGLMFRGVFDRGKDFQSYRDQIAVSETRIEFGEDRHGPTVAVLGRLENRSNREWQEIHFTAEFYDAAGRMIDAGEVCKYALHIPAHSTVGYKLSFQQEFPSESYASCKVRVVYAKDAGALF
jgi:hypothetical protein